MFNVVSYSMICLIITLTNINHKLTLDISSLISLILHINNHLPLHLQVLEFFANKVALLAILSKICNLFEIYNIYTMFQLYGNVSSIILMLWDGAYSNF